MPHPERQYDVVGVGIATQDFLGVAHHEPLPGSKQRLAQWVEQGGGPVATALVTLARLGMHPCLVGSVGSDDYGQRIVRELHSEGVATDGVHVLAGTSHRSFILVEPEQQRRTIWSHKERPGLDSIPLERSLITSARALLLDTYMPHTAMTAARWMREAGKPVVIDAERCEDATLALLPWCDVIVASGEFGREASGTPDAAQAAQVIYQRYQQHVQAVIVTSGAAGSWCVSRYETFHTPAAATTPRDTTGAGDVFHGALLYGMLQQWSLRESTRFASATAALKCRAVGGRAGIPTLAEVTTWLQTNQDQFS